MLDLFQITKTEGKFYIAPLKKHNSGQGAVKWLVECDTEEEAKAIKNDFIGNNLPTPLSDTEGRFEKVMDSAKDFEGKASPIYRLK